MGHKGWRRVGITLALAILAPAAAPAFEASVKTIESRPGVTESFLLVRPRGRPSPA